MSVEELSASVLVSASYCDEIWTCTEGTSLERSGKGAGCTSTLGAAVCGAPLFDGDEHDAPRSADRQTPPSVGTSLLTCLRPAAASSRRRREHWRSLPIGRQATSRSPGRPL